MAVTTVYVAMICDRHTDPIPEVFTTEEAAVAYARAVAADWLHEDTAPDGWLYYAKHPTEEDAVWVLARTVDGTAVVS